MANTFESWLSARPPEETDGPNALPPGTVLDAHRVTARLGHGGFADVYRATDADGRDVAIKILHRLDEKTRLRFELETNILALVRHPNFPRFLGSGSFEGRPYIVQELLFPCDLPHADRAVAAFLTGIMSAVETLHLRGFVHRDIKPANILSRRDGTPVLADFGLAAPISALQRERAALSIEGGKNVAVGTAGFSAPEQFTGGAAGRAADVHALGALVGACFGEEMPRCWKRLYLKATNSNPKVRYQTVAEMRRALARRHLGATIALALLAVVLAAAAVRLWQQGHPPPQPPPHFQVPVI